MSTDTRDQTRRLGVETTGIEIVDEAQRSARPSDLFWPWFAANVSVFGLSYANLGVLLALVLSFAATLVLRRAKVRRQEQREGAHA